MAIIAFGNNDGCFFEYVPKLPSCFAENLNFAPCWGHKADFLRLTINDRMGIDCWFVDEEGNTFYYSLEEIKTKHPSLYVSIVTHMVDVVEHIELA